MTLLYIILCLCFSALFSGIELAFLSASRLRVELNKSKGLLSGKILSNYYEKPAAFISTLLVGHNIVLVVFGTLIADYLHFPFLSEHSFITLLLSTFISTILILVVGDFIPKTIFRINPDGILMALAIPFHYLLYMPLSLFAFFFEKSSLLLIRAFTGKKYEVERPKFSHVDIEHFVKDSLKSERSDDKEEELDTEIFEKALHLKNVKVRECMVPRIEIEAVEKGTNIDTLRKKFIDTQLSRILVFDETLDNVIGYVHHHSLLKNPKSIKDCLFEMPSIPESMNVVDLLTELKKTRKSIACVIDEYGGTAGIVTMEDIVEEIFGEIHDELDNESLSEKKLSDTEFIFSGRLEIDYLNEKYKLDIPEGEYETLSGYIVTQYEHIPEVGETLTLDQYKIEVISATDTRLETIKLTRINSKD